MASTNIEPHAAVIQSLTILYTLLTDLHYLPASSILTPPHPASAIDTAAATAAGFTDPEALALLTRIPYLDPDVSSYLIAPETESLCYINTRSDDSASEEAFDFARDPTYQDRTDILRPGVINLTRAKNGGTSLMYDVKKKTITAWNHFNDEVDDWTENRAWGMEEEENPLYTWIKDWVGLTWVPQFINDAPNVVSFEGPPEVEEAGEEEKSLRRCYVEAGWDADAISQGGQGTVVERLDRARARAARDLRVEELESKRTAWEEKWYS